MSEDIPIDESPKRCFVDEDDNDGPEGVSDRISVIYSILSDELISQKFPYHIFIDFNKNEIIRMI